MPGIKPLGYLKKPGLATGGFCSRILQGGETIEDPAHGLLDFRLL